MKFQGSTQNGRISFACARLIVAFAAVLAPTVAPATDETFDAMLSAAQVVAGGGSTSTATGFATFVFDSSARSITTDLSWTGLTGPTDRSHIHDGPPGALSSNIFLHEVMLNLVGGSAVNFGSPVVSCFVPDGCREATGFVHDVFDMPAPGDGSCFVYDNCNFADLLSRAEHGGLYIDIHTQTYPEGEIRGELVPVGVPEPSTWLLLGPGLAWLAYWRRKRAAQAHSARI
jgi:CHRD domain/PEP-CTERM motif